MKNQQLELSGEIEVAHNSVDSMQIVTQEDNKLANSYDKVLTGLEKAVHELCDENVTTTHKAWKTALAQRNGLLDPIKTAKSKLRKKIASFFDEQKRKAKEQEEALRKKAEKEGSKFTPEVTPNIEKPTGQIVKGMYYAEVVDKSKIPLDYMQPDMKTLNKRARNKRGESDIPGVIFKKKTTVYTRKG